jgi:membrane protein CcdC involved in cytochrome C biogenesis
MWKDELIKKWKKNHFKRFYDDKKLNMIEVLVEIKTWKFFFTNNNFSNNSSKAKDFTFIWLNLNVYEISLNNLVSNCIFYKHLGFSTVLWKLFFHFHVFILYHLFIRNNDNLRITNLNWYKKYVRIFSEYLYFADEDK